MMIPVSKKAGFHGRTHHFQHPIHEPLNIPSMKRPEFMDGLRKFSIPSIKSQHFMDRILKTDIPSMKSPLFMDRILKMM